MVVTSPVAGPLAAVMTLLAKNVVWSEGRAGQAHQV